jgi:hypothetical protein
MKYMRWLLGAFYVLASASPLLAQAINPPPRPGAPPRQGDTRQELGVSGSVQAGYDENQVTQGAVNAPAPIRSGQSMHGSVSLRYLVGNSARFVDVSGSESVYNYSNSVTGPRYASSVMTVAATPLGARTTARVTHSLQFAPYFSLGAVAQPDPAAGPVGGIDTIDTTPATGYVATRSRANIVSSSLDRTLTRRTSVNVGYTFAFHDYLDGPAFDTTTHSLTAGIGHTISRSVTMSASAHKSNSDYVLQDGEIRPHDALGVDLSVGYRRQVSPTRGYSLSVSGGARESRSIAPISRLPVRYWAPSGSGSASFAIGRSWSVTANYTRALRVLQGIAPDTFQTQSTRLNVGGVIAGPVDTVVTVGFSDGKTVRASETTRPSAFEALAAAVQFRVRLVSSLALMISATRYDHRLNPDAQITLGVAQRVQRSGARVGVTWSLPLFSF